MTSVASWEDLWANAKEADMVNIAESFGVRLKRGANGELTSACPAGCAKTDGFIINPKKGVFLCRPSGAAGDIIAMVEHCRGCTKVEAAEFLSGQDRPGKSEAPDDKAKAEAKAKREKQQATAARKRALQDRLDEFKLVKDGEAVASILERAVAFSGTPGSEYLEDRGAGLPKVMTRDLRFVEALHYWGYADLETDEITLLATIPAMIALVRALDGDVVGIHVTYLNPDKPEKWVAPCDLLLPKEHRRNPSKKYRKAVRDTAGSMIRLGAVGDMLVIGEGIETVGAYFNRGFAPEDATFAAAGDLGRMVGGAVAMIDHPNRKADNRLASIPNGIPDPTKPGVLLPPHVKQVLLLGDGDSDWHATRAKLLTGARRYRNEGREAFIDMAPEGEDFASMKVGARP